MTFTHHHCPDHWIERRQVQGANCRCGPTVFRCAVYTSIIHVHMTGFELGTTKPPIWPWDASFGRYRRPPFASCSPGAWPSQSKSGVQVKSFCEWVPLLGDAPRWAKQSEHPFDVKSKTDQKWMTETDNVQYRPTSCGTMKYIIAAGYRE